MSSKPSPETTPNNRNSDSTSAQTATATSAVEYVLDHVPSRQAVQQRHRSGDGNREDRGPRVPPAAREPVDGREQQEHRRDVDQVGGVPAAAEQEVKRCGQRGDQRSLEAEHGIEFGQIAGDAAVSQCIVHGQAVGQIPGVVPVGR